MNTRKKPCAVCDECGAALTETDEIFTWDDGRAGKTVCGECFDSLFSGLTRLERAALIGSTVYCGEWEGLTGV